MTEEKQELKNVDEALLYVMENCGYVQKTGKVDVGKGYMYAGEADLIKALRPHIAAAGLTFRCIDIEIIQNEDFTSTKTYQGKVTESLNHRILAKYTYIFKHAASQTEAHAVALGDGIDFGDKAGYKAATGALKYILRQTFIIETGDDPDNDASVASVLKYDENEPTVFDGAVAEYAESLKIAADLSKLKEIFTEAWESKFSAKDKEHLQAVYEVRKQELMGAD